jgi:CRISPR-associated exonuclease Cas4
LGVVLFRDFKRGVVSTTNRNCSFERGMFLKNISGTCIYYFFICKRKLWYHLNDISLEKYNEDVAIGKLVHENSYERQKNNVVINGEIVIDFIDNYKVCHEVKKSKKLEIAAIYQMKYYLYTLLKNGLEIKKGIIDYPLIKRREVVEISASDITGIENIIDEIQEMANMPVTTFPYLKKGFCKKCAFYELCVI